MRIAITRKSDPLAFGQAVKIYINGKPTIQLAERQGAEMTLYIPGQETLVLSVQELKRTSLLIQDGDHILLERNPIFATLSLTGLTLLLASLLFQFSSILAFPLLLSSFMVDQLKLSKIN